MPVDETLKQSPPDIIWIKPINREKEDKARISKMEVYHTVKQALEFASKLKGVENFIITQAGHTFPKHDEAEKEIQKYAKNLGLEPKVQLAYDGMKMTLGLKSRPSKVEKGSKPLAEEERGLDYHPSPHSGQSSDGLTENFSAQELYNGWAQEKLDAGEKLLVEKKYDGFRAIISKKDKDIQIWFEDSQQDKSEIMPEIVNAIESIPCDLVLSGECMIFKKNKPLSRLKITKMLSKQFQLQDGERVVFVLSDFLDTANLALKDRKEELKSFYEKYLQLNSNFELSEGIVVDSKESLFDAMIKKSEEPGSGGAIVKMLSSSYIRGGKENWSEVKTDLLAKVVVLEKNENKAGGYNYVCGILR